MLPTLPPLAEVPAHEVASTEAASAEAASAAARAAAHAAADLSVPEFALAFKMLGDETRLRIVLHVSRQGRAHVAELCQLLGQSQPLVSHHLALLRGAGLVEMRPEGRHHYYTLSTEKFARLMESLSGHKRCEAPCARFLECVFG